MSRDLRLLALSLFLWGIGEGLFFYLQPVYLAELGADAVQVGVILGLAGAAMAFVHIPAGLLADRFGRKTLLVAAWFIGTISTLLMFLAVGLRLFVVALIGYSLTAFVMSPLSSYVTTARGSWSTGRALTTISASFNAGSVVGPLAGGLLASQVGIRPLFGVAAALFLASTVLIVVLRSQPLEPPHVDGRIRPLLSNKAAGRILIVSFAAMLAAMLGWSLTPLYLNEVRGLPVGQVGALGSFFALGTVVLSLGLGRSPARRGSMLAQACVAGAYVLLWRGLTLPVYAAGYFLAGGMRASRNLFNAQVERVVERSHLGLAFGVSETVAAGGLILAPLLAGLLYRANPSAPYLASLALIGISLILSAWLLPSDRPDEIQPALEAAG
jgi:MFS family permease